MTFRLIITNIKKIITNNWQFSILIIGLLTVLTVRAIPENHMDMDSATAILSARWWARDGFLKHHLLELNAGYGKIVRYFEEKELNEHAQGSVAGGLIGHKLYNAHYPSMHVLPIALLMKIGIEKLFILRILPIIASILALIFLYLFVKSLYNKHVALIATAYFGISPLFIKWADSLAYAPYEDVLRFLILLLGLAAFNYSNNQQTTMGKKNYLYLAAIWICYAFLALVSFNSTFFVFTWLLGLSLIYAYQKHNYRVKNKILIFFFLTLFWASAPIFSFVLRLIQSAVYLGWHNTWLDFYGAFIYAGNRPSLGLLIRGAALIKPFFSMTGLYNFYAFLVPMGITKLKPFILFASPFLTLIAILAIMRLKKITEYKIFSFPLMILFVAPMTQTFLMPFLGFRDSIGRLFAPFIGIVIGIILHIVLLARNKIKNEMTSDKLLFGFLCAAMFSLFAIQIILNFVPRIWSPYAPISTQDISFAKTMQKMIAGEGAVFMINASDTQIPEEELKKRNALYDPTHYQTNYIDWEYYFDMPMLNFINSSYLVRDLIFLEKRSEYPFTAIITSDDKEIISELHKNLNAKKLPLSTIQTLENRHYFTVSPASQ